MLQLTVGGELYDRTVPLQNGTVQPEGIELNFIHLGVAELFRRQAQNAEFDVAEFSLNTYTYLQSQGNNHLIAIPVFPSRRFRHSEMYVNPKAGIREPKDLAGKRVGTREYQLTAGTWQRGMLQDDYGVRPEQIDWYFGSYNQPGPNPERIPMELPANLRTQHVPETKCLDQMLDAGELDAVIGAEVSRSFLARSPNVTRLFPNVKEVEADYYRRTGIIPIMHTVVIKRAVYERHPWIALSLCKAYVKAKTVARADLPGAGPFAMDPWMGLHLGEVEAIMGRDPFVYGLEPNRHLLETFLRYNHEQGMSARLLKPEELFAPETLEDIEVAAR